MEITKGQAREFYRDLKGSVWGNADYPNCASVSEEWIADRMEMPLDRVMDFLIACARNGITERQGGGWVI